MASQYWVNVNVYLSVLNTKSIKLKWIWEVRKKTYGEQEQEKAHKDGLTIRAQRAHFTDVSSKPMEFVLVAWARDQRGRGREKTLISFGSLRLHLTPSIKKRARSVERALPQNQYRHKEQGDRDKESDRCGERKFKIQVERKRSWGNKKMQKGRERNRCTGKRGDEVALHCRNSLHRVHRWV